LKPTPANRKIIKMFNKIIPISSLLRCTTAAPAIAIANPVAAIGVRIGKKSS